MEKIILYSLKFGCYSIWLSIFLFWHLFWQYTPQNFKYLQFNHFFNQTRFNSHVISVDTLYPKMPQPKLHASTHLFSPISNVLGSRRLFISLSLLHIKTLDVCLFYQFIELIEFFSQKKKKELIEFFYAKKKRKEKDIIF